MPDSIRGVRFKFLKWLVDNAKDKFWGLLTVWLVWLTCAGQGGRGN